MHALLDGTSVPIFKFMVVAVVILGIVALGLACFVLLYHLFSSRRRHGRRRHVEAATILLAPHLLHTDHLPQLVRDSRARHGDWATAVVLRASRHELQGEAAEHLGRQLVAMGEVALWQKDVGSIYAWRRARACRELGEIGAPEARQTLLEASHDPRPEVRRPARDGLLADGSAEAVARAIECYRADMAITGPWKRGFYSRLAGGCGGAEALRQLLLERALPPSEEKLALEALGDARDRESIPLLRQRLDAPDPELRASAARALGKLEDSDSRQRLVELLADQHWFVRAAAAKACETLPLGTADLSRLRTCLQDDAWWVRRNAAHALVCQGEAGATILLEVVDRDSDRFAREAALAALGLGLLTPYDRQRLAGMLPRLLSEPGAAALWPLLRALPGSALPRGA